MSNLLNYNSADEIVKDAFIPTEKKRGFDFLDDILPMVKTFYEKRQKQLLQSPIPESERNPTVTPTPTPTPTPVRTGDVLGQQTGPLRNIANLIKIYFPQEEWERAWNVMMGESGGRPDAVGDKYPIRGQLIPSYGLFQIRGFKDRPAPEQLLDPESNIKYAAQMFKKQGWSPWTAARKLGYVE